MANYLQRIAQSAIGTTSAVRTALPPPPILPQPVSASAWPIKVAEAGDLGTELSKTASPGSRQSLSAGTFTDSHPAPPPGGGDLPDGHLAELQESGMSPSPTPRDLSPATPALEAKKEAFTRTVVPADRHIHRHEEKTIVPLGAARTSTIPPQVAFPPPLPNPRSHAFVPHLKAKDGAEKQPKRPAPAAEPQESVARAVAPPDERVAPKSSSGEPEDRHLTLEHGIRPSPALSVSMPTRTSSAPDPHTRITIGRVEVQVNNQIADQRAAPVTPSAASSTINFLEARYLTRFGLKP